ncbi:hypothetical protein BO71DRAFT_313111 [Aspergillus ellipticus CBS 707.79]|uniref:DUF7924 domain-containing protein n=1 Tax=Aspergillus ellipticus CBS 707.79 TaxID=1448320 RepID=A0A319DU18_9EURO|nr:hypothetical protein BO71DRAFT_313111 [Aspergillus ellipticus CBS 707.79]
MPVPPPPSTWSAQRSRSSSPGKPSDAQYRVGHLRSANIFVDHDIPMEISRCLQIHIFPQVVDDTQLLQRVSDKLWTKAKDLVRKPSGEAEWTEALFTAIDELRPAGLEIVRNRDWREDLKPPVYNPRTTIPRKRNQSHRPLEEGVTPDSLHGSPHPLQATEKTVPLFKLKDPRPDICVGLSDDSLWNALEPKKDRTVARNFLFDLQNTSSLISDPHVIPLGLRFPFLIIEAKSAATGGNLYQAQNQAAVGGSTAIRILKSLSAIGSSEQEAEDNGMSAELPHFEPHMVFSVTTEGPIHELWLHFQMPQEDDFSMVCIGAWRTTLRDGSMDLVSHISAVLRWGHSQLKDGIVSILVDL